MARTAKKYTAQEITEAFLALLEGGVVAAEVDEDEDLVEEDLEDEEEDGEEEDAEVPTPDEVAEMKIGELRTMAVSLGFDEQKLKSGILEEYAEKYGDDEGDEDEEEAEEDEGDEEGYTREELEEMELPELKEILKANEIKIPRGADQDTLIDLILDEEEDDEEEADEEEEEVVEEESDEETLSEEDLKGMSLPDLRSLAKQLEIKVRIPRTATTDAKKKKVYVETILATADEEEE